MNKEFTCAANKGRMRGYAMGIAELTAGKVRQLTKGARDDEHG